MPIACGNTISYNNNFNLDLDLNAWSGFLNTSIFISQNASCFKLFRNGRPNY